jgi:arylsulfatase A-like enzyme
MICLSKNKDGSLEKVAIFSFFFYNAFMIKRKKKWLLLIIAMSAFLVCLPSCKKETTPKPKQAPAESPNVLLISIDTLRPDHLGSYGYHRKTSPRFDKLASEGVLYENHISSTSWTLPAHAALFSSLLDSVHGCIETNKKLPEGISTLAEVFAKAGYKTAGFFSGPYLHPAFGLGQGFQHYENCTSYARAIDTAPAKKWAMDAGVMRKSHRDITNPIVYAAFKKWFDQNRGSRFFMFIHMWDVHFDFIPPPPYDKMFDPDYTGTVTGADFFFDPAINAKMPKRDLEHLIALYDGEIAWTDHHLGKILDDLENAGLLDKTVVAVTSDHGTEFFEHGNKSHRQTLFDEVIRIPLVIRYPASLPRGVRVNTQTHLIDVAPTLVELAGLPPMSGIMGRSLMPGALNQTSTSTPESITVSELFSVGRRIRAIRTLQWKFTDHMNLKLRYYVNLEKDPHETRLRTDLAGDPGRKYLDRYRRVSRDLTEWRKRTASKSDRSTIPDDVLEQLKSLGYINEK